MIELGSITDKFSGAGQKVARRAINWTFARVLVSDVEADRPTMTVASSREYSEKIEAETILRILKSITDKYARESADTI